MTPSIELLRVGGRAPSTPWTLGPQRGCGRSSASLAEAMARSDADALLVWDDELPMPPAELLTRLLDGPADAWHAGLLLGQGGRPGLLDRADPLWMLNRDPAPDIEATSWRLSLRALLVRTDVLDQLGGPNGHFDSMAGTALDLGLRWIRSGAILRHCPELLPEPARPDAEASFDDEVRIVARHKGMRWGLWAVGRAVVTGELPLRSLPSVRRVLDEPNPVSPRRYEPTSPARHPVEPHRVTAVVPTVDRYPYLETLLRQLAEQTVPLHEVIVIDQTAPDHRRHDLEKIAPDLPVTVIEQDEPGQCTSRNAGLLAATGDLVLFVDDDDEVPVDLVEAHLRRLALGNDASSGGVDDATAGPPPPGFRHRRTSDVFPTNNTMLRRAALAGSGLFDPAYDRGPRADHDLGMRLYLSGALLVYAPEPMLYHHHAPSGGLRTHGARRVTRAGSRRTILERHLPSVTETYLGQRYFTPAQQHEAELITLVSTLTGEGPRWRQLARAATQLLLLPDTRRKVRETNEAASRLLANRPEIPRLPEAP